MTVTASPTRQSRTPQRAGHLVGALVNAALFYAVNAWPGWAALPFLTNDTVDVLPLVNASILAGLVANLLYVFADYAWLTSLGEILSTAVGLAALVQVWRVFPFDFDPTPVDWARVVRGGPGGRHDRQRHRNPRPDRLPVPGRHAVVGC